MDLHTESHLIARPIFMGHVYTWREYDNILGMCLDTCNILRVLLSTPAKKVEFNNDTSNNN